MRCREVRKSLDRFLRQELTPSVREEIESHLSDCESCQAELVRLQRLEELLTAAPSPPIPEGLAERMLERARRDVASGIADVSIRHQLRERLGRRVRFVAGTAAALAGGLLLGVSLGNQTWDSVPSAAIEEGDPVAGSGLGLLVEPGGDSLAGAYLALTVGGAG